MMGCDRVEFALSLAGKRRHKYLPSGLQISLYKIDWKIRYYKVAEEPYSRSLSRKPCEDATYSSIWFPNSNDTKWHRHLPSDARTHSTFPMQSPRYVLTRLMYWLDNSVASNVGRSSMMSICCQPFATVVLIASYRLHLYEESVIWYIWGVNSSVIRSS